VIGKIKTYLAMQAGWHRELLLHGRDRRRRRALRLPEFPSAEEVLAAPCCFVLSTGRCGTAFLTEIFDRSARLSVHHTPKPELEYVSSLVHRQRPALEALELAVLAARFELLVAAYRSGVMYVETNNRISFFAPALARLLPNARFIHLVRHPADFVRSGMRRGYYADGVVQHQRLMPRSHPEWSSWTELEKIAWEWNEINGFIEGFKGTAPESRVLTIRSEALFRNREAIISVLEFVGIADDAALVSKLTHERLKPVNEQRKGGFPKYEAWSDADKASLKRIATLASVYGYEYL
jgi:hypothetical protein